MDYFNKLQKYFICFVLYAVLGWSYEVILETFIYQWGFTNRGVLFGIWSRSNVLFALSWEIGLILLNQ